MHNKIVCKAKYNNKWFNVKRINFDTDYITLINNNQNNLSVKMGNTLSIPLDKINDVKFIK